jgi:DNA mismatch endonuclease (patch repair protein)
VILIHGCFWHRHSGCRLAYRPKSRPAFWEHKFSTNVVRDHRQMQALVTDGWRVIVVWECGLRGTARTASTLERLSVALVSANRTYLEIPTPFAGAPRPLPNERTKPLRETEYGKRSTS